MSGRIVVDPKLAARRPGSAATARIKLTVHFVIGHWNRTDAEKRAVIG